jgi:hypothetical protein
MPDFIPVPPTSAIADKQVRAVLDVLSQNIQISIDKFNAINTGTNTAASASKGGFNSFGLGANSTVNNTTLAASYTKANMLADSAALFAAKLNKSAADILSGPIDFTTYGGFKTSGMTIAVDGTATGQGVAFTSKGIVGRNSTTTTFTINSTTGDASFGGTLTAATGTFIGTVSAGNFVTSGGTIGTTYGTNAWIAGTSGLGYNAGDSWFGGTMTIGGKLIVNGAFTTGGVNVAQYISTSATDMALYTQNTGSGSAAAFYNTTTGAFGSPTLFVQQGGTGPVLKAINPYAGGIGSLFSTNQNYAFIAARLNDTAPVAWFQGAIALSLSDSLGTAWQLSNPSSTINAAGGGYYLAGDGAWHSVSSITSGVSSFNGRPGAVTLLSSDVTSALGYTPYNSSNPSGYVTTSTSSLSNYSTTATTLAYIAAYSSQFNANFGTAFASSNQISLYGSSSTGIAGAYVGTSGSGNTVTFTVQTSSPSDIRLKEEITDSDLGLSFVKQLRPVSYKLKADPKHQKGYGFIADEVEKLVELGSSLVYEDPNWQVEDQIGFKTIHYPSYIAVLTKAIQELSAKVDVLEAKLAETRT